MSEEHNMINFIEKICNAIFIEHYIERCCLNIIDSVSHNLF